MRVRVLLCAAALGTTAALAGAVPEAEAAHHSLSFSFVHTKVTANTRPQLTVRSHGYGKKIVFHLQRQMGTRHVYQNIATLHVKNGLVTAPKVPMGKYRYRIVARKGKRVFAVSAARSLTSFGRVSFATLLGGGHPTRTTTVGGHTFNYVEMPNLQSYMYDDTGTPVWQMTHSTCRALHLDVAVGTDGGDRTDALTLAQATRDPQRVDLPTGEISSANFTMVPGQSWSLAISGDYYMYLNGYGECFNDSAVTFSQG